MLVLPANILSPFVSLAPFTHGTFNITKFGYSSEAVVVLHSLKGLLDGKIQCQLFSCVVMTTWGMLK